jgi:hypothetical protein
MIPIFPTSEQVKTVRAKLSSLFNTISDLNALLLDQQCPTQYDITNQIPLWIVQEKEERRANGNTTLSIFDFIQKYYDWLYCDSSTGAQYQLAQRLLDTVDVEKTRSQFLERLSKIYADGFDPKNLSKNGGLIKEENLRKFLKGIRRTFYHKKTTEDGIRYFFESLYGLDEEDIQIQIPKKYILRLNGGKFYDPNFQFISKTGAGEYEALNAMMGSYLNGSRMQDGNWIQDWSYLLKVGIPGSEYKSSYLQLAHPAGLKVVFEKTLADYSGPASDDTTPTVCDSAFLRNYSPYGISFDYRTSTKGFTYPSYWNSIAGLTMLGLGRTLGCCGGYTGFTGSTYVFPNWSSESNYRKTNFKDINISTMFEMCYPSDSGGSPNTGYSTCS